MLRSFLNRFRFSVPVLVQRFEVPTDGVLHVGANFGQEADEYDHLGFGTVVWVEGYAPYFKRLSKTIKGRPNHLAVELMVSDVEGEKVRFSIASNTGSSTALKVASAWHQTFRGLTLSDGGEVLCGRLDQALDAVLPPERRTTIRFMVLDIEGSELKALRSMGAYLERLEFALIEISVRRNFEGGPLLRDIDAFMAARGFRRIYIKVSASSGDALYRKVAALSELSRTMMRVTAEGWQFAAALRLTDLSMGIRRVVKKLT
jgi:FkbM family methyltransferase